MKASTISVKGQPEAAALVSGALTPSIFEILSSKLRNSSYVSGSFKLCFSKKDSLYQNPGLMSTLIGAP